MRNEVDRAGRPRATAAPAEGRRRTGSVAQLAVRVIKQLLQAHTKRWRQARGPGGVQQADADEVAKMSAILVPPGDQLHPHHRFESGYLKFDGALRFVKIRHRELVARPNFFAGEDEMDAITRFALWTVGEGIDVEDMMVDEAGSFQRRAGGRQIGTPDEQIDIARGADGAFVNSADPLGDGISTGDGIEDAGGIERASRPT